MLPFSKDQFFLVFSLYNSAIGPGAVLLYVGALMSVFAVFRKSQNLSKFALSYLSFLWLWMGLVYHWSFFSVINPAAWLFGAVFIAQGILLARQAWLGVSVQISSWSSPKRVFQIISFLYALLIYPLLGFLLGHGYPGGPIFGLPCPTTIFTFAILSGLSYSRKNLLLVSIIPILWSIIGTYAAIGLTVYEDYALLISAFVFVMVSFYRNQNTKITAVSY